MNASVPVPTQDNNAAPTVAADVPVSQTKAVSKVHGDKIIFNDSYEILLTHGISDFEHPYADVYEAVHKDNRSQSCLAYAIKGHYPARLDIIRYLVHRDIPGLINVKECGVTNWVDDTQRLVILTNKPVGSPLLARNAPKRTPIAEEVLRKSIIKPIFQALQVISHQGYFHGNVNGGNIFWSAQDNSDAVLGECISCLPGAVQHPLYETIERAMADPVAKGESTSSDDVYALGILVAILLRGYDPLAGKDVRHITEEKINRTSFTVMTDGLQLTPRMSDFLRSTLSDDARLRWTMDQLESWINGNRAPLKQHASLKKATRALDFNGGKYIRARLLARDFYDNPAEAVQLIESGNLVKWLDRSLIDPTLIEDVNNAIGRANYNGKIGSYEDRLLCYVSMALDPAGPIRYKNIRAMPLGLGSALLDAIETNQSIQPIAEIIREKIAWAWLNQTDNIVPDINEWAKRFDYVSKIILRRSMDYGVERCLYDLTPHAPCVSPALSSYYILDCEQLLQALNKKGQDKDRPQNMIDRHTAAFICARDSKDNSGLVNMLESDDPRKKSLSLLMLCQDMQRRYQVQQLSGLAGWLQPDAELIAQRFFNLKFRKDVVKLLQSDIKSGSLTRMLNSIDNPVDIARDRLGFSRAVQVYTQLDKEYNDISTHLKTNNLFGRETGRQIAAIVSAILSGVFIVGALFLQGTHGGVF